MTQQEYNAGRCKKCQESQPVDPKNLNQPKITNETHYRFCFSCDKWKAKQEINEIDAGEQPGGKSGKTYNCNVCKKDLGESIQIFNCDKHPSEILKVWGTMDGENKEKVFYKECPQKQGTIKPIPTEPKQPSKGISGGAIALIISAVVLVLAGGFG
jgi:hypothetical protein